MLNLNELFTKVSSAVFLVTIGQWVEAYRIFGLFLSFPPFLLVLNCLIRYIRCARSGAGHKQESLSTNLIYLQIMARSSGIVCVH